MIALRYFCGFSLQIFPYAFFCLYPFRDRFRLSTKKTMLMGKTQVLPVEQVRGDVEFSHVRFGYTPDKTIIQDFSAHAKPGQKVAIVGPTGAGKIGRAHV